MNIENTLLSLGLSSGESKVYLALLKLGSSPVNKIKEETNLHRTTIYDFLEKLLNKGLVSYATKKNAKYFQAASPEQLHNLIKEKEELLNESLPQLKQLEDFKKEDINVEVYKGVEGLKSVLNLILKERKDTIGINIDESKYKENLPFFMEQFFRKEQEIGLKERMIIEKNSKITFPHSHITYRTLPKEFFGPSPSFTFGDYVIQHIWDPLTSIVIKNKQVASSYRTYLNMIWKLASPVKLINNQPSKKRKRKK